MISADRSFDIEDSVGSLCSSQHLPKARTNLSRIEVVQSSNIANVQIHVEHVIGNIRQKKFDFLQAIDFVSATKTVTILDKIVCYLCICVTQLCHLNKIFYYNHDYVLIESLIRAPLSIVKRRDATCVQDLPSPAMPLQWAIIILPVLPPSSAMTHKVRIFSLFFSE